MLLFCLVWVTERQRIPHRSATKRTKRVWKISDDQVSLVSMSVASVRLRGATAEMPEHPTERAEQDVTTFMGN